MDKGNISSVGGSSTFRTDGFSEETEYMKQFTDDDFQYSAAQFDVDFLEKLSSEESSNASNLARESLFVKFDPLVDKQPVSNKTANKLNKIPEDDTVDKLPRTEKVTSITSNLLMMDTPPKSDQVRSSHDHGHSHDLRDSHPLTESHVIPIDLDNASDMTIMAQSAQKKMYTEEQVAEMIEMAKKDEIEQARQKYEPEIAALEKESAELEKKPKQVYDECMFADSILSSQHSLLQNELIKWKHLTAEHEQLETLTVFCHEKLKEQYLSLAEQRDTTLKSEKFRVKSFQELQQRYLKLQDATKKLYQNQCRLSSLKANNNEASAQLKAVHEESLIKQDELNMSYESLQKELSSKSAAERAQTRTIELQVSSMEKDLQQKEQEKHQLTQIAEELMKELRNSE